MELFIDPKTNRFYYGSKVSCSHCNNEIQGHFYINAQWSKKKQGVFRCTCFSCVGKIHRTGIIDENYPCYATKSIPNCCVRKILTPPSLGMPKGDISVFDVNIRTEAEIIDNTVYSGRIFQVQERINIFQERLKELDQPLPIDGDYFDIIKKSEVLKNENNQTHNI